MITAGDTALCPDCGGEYVACPKAGNPDAACAGTYELSADGLIVDTVKAHTLDLTADETDTLLKMVRARIQLKQAFTEPHPELTVLVAKLLNWSKQVKPS